MDLLTALKDTPVPTLLIIGGFIFLFLGIATIKKPFVIDVQPPSNRRLAIIFGIVFVTTGLYSLLQSPSQQTENTPTETPTISIINVTEAATDTLIPSPIPNISTFTPVPLNDFFTLDLRPICGETYTSTSNTPIKLRYGTWYVRGEDLAIINAEHLTVTLVLDGKVISGEKQPVQRVTSSFPGAYCGEIDLEEGFGLFYVTQIEALSVGSHPGQVIYSLDAPVVDGYGGEYESGHLTTLRFTIVVK